MFIFPQPGTSYFKYHSNEDKVKAWKPKSFQKKCILMIQTEFFLIQQLTVFITFLAGNGWSICLILKRYNFCHGHTIKYILNYYVLKIFWKIPINLLLCIIKIQEYFANCIFSEKLYFYVLCLALNVSHILTVCENFFTVYRDMLVWIIIKYATCYTWKKIVRY